MSYFNLFNHNCFINLVLDSMQISAIKVVLYSYFSTTYGKQVSNEYFFELANHYGKLDLNGDCQLTPASFHTQLQMLDVSEDEFIQMLNDKLLAHYNLEFKLGLPKTNSPANRFVNLVFELILAHVNTNKLRRAVTKTILSKGIKSIAKVTIK